MSTNKTQNYNLHSWVPEDDFLRSEFNDNFTSLDGALKALSDGLSAETQARAAAVTAEENARNQAIAAEQAAREKAVSDEVAARKKAVSDEAAARASAVTAEQNARTAAVNSLTASLNTLASSKAELVFGTYTGSAASPNWDQTISLGFTPKAVFIIDQFGRTGVSPYGSNRIYGGLVLPGYPLQGEENGYTSAEIVAGGFVVHDYRGSTNSKGSLYFYVALK